MGVATPFWTMTWPINIFVFWAPVDFNFHNDWKIWQEKWISRAAQSSEKRILRKYNFYKRIFYEKLIVKKHSKWESSKVILWKTDN